MVIDRLENKLSKSLGNAIFGYFLENAIDKGESVEIEQARKLSVELSAQIVSDNKLSLDHIREEYHKLINIS